MRRRIAAMMLVLLLAGSGCLGVLAGDEPLRFEATEATVSTGALDATGYERTNLTSQTVRRSVSVVGRERSVVVTNWIGEYERQLDIGPAGAGRSAFVLFSTPKAEVLGRPLNPIGGLSNQELLSRIGSQFGGVDVGDRVATRNVTVLGSHTEVGTFAATATVAGRDVPVLVHVTTVAHGDDFVVAVGIHPRGMDGERQRVFRLLRGVRHG